MDYHANATLTQTQRRRVQALHYAGVSQSALARQFGVHRRTIQRWVGRTDVADRSTRPHQSGHTVVTDAYRAAVRELRTQFPHYGPKRIAHELRDRFPTANGATVWRILRDAGLTQRTPKKTDTPSDPGGTPSGATGHSGIARDSRATREGVQD